MPVYTIPGNCLCRCSGGPGLCPCPDMPNAWSGTISDLAPLTPDGCHFDDVVPCQDNPFGEPLCDVCDQLNTTWVAEYYGYVPLGSETGDIIPGPATEQASACVWRSAPQDFTGHVLTYGEPCEDGSVYRDTVKVCTFRFTFQVTVMEGEEHLLFASLVGECVETGSGVAGSGEEAGDCATDCAFAFGYAWRAPLVGGSGPGCDGIAAGCTDMELYESGSPSCDDMAGSMALRLCPA